MFRTLKSQSAYDKYNKTKSFKDCVFCETPKEQIFSKSKYFLIVKNRFPYDHWDTGKVEEHLMVVPKRHLTSISQFNQTEKTEYLSILAKFETEGFDTYSRSGLNKGKSQPHFHTHLIKATSKKFWFLLFLRNPYLSFQIY